MSGSGTRMSIVIGEKFQTDEICDFFIGMSGSADSPRGTRMSIVIGEIWEENTCFGTSRKCLLELFYTQVMLLAGHVTNPTKAPCFQQEWSFAAKQNFRKPL